LERREVIGVSATLLFVVALGSACAETDRHRVLTFFFEGVPTPGQEQAADQVEGPVEPETLTLAERLALANRRREFITYMHEPFAKHECVECHNMYDGGKVKKLAGGLCISCHEELLKEKVHVHGPVAVGACLQCHHHHQSKLEFLLLDEPETLCLGCHLQSSLEDDEYHDQIGVSPDGCLECHDPHGGDNNLFLKRPGVESGE